MLPGMVRIGLLFAISCRDGARPIPARPLWRHGHGPFAPTSPRRASSKPATENIALGATNLQARRHPRLRKPATRSRPATPLFKVDDQNLWAYAGPPGRPRRCKAQLEK